MATDYHHGVLVIEINEGTRPIRTVQTAVIGFVATAPNADAAFFPENRPVLLTDILDGLEKAGNSGLALRTGCHQRSVQPTDHCSSRTRRC